MLQSDGGCCDKHRSTSWCMIMATKHAYPFFFFVFFFTLSALWIVAPPLVVSLNRQDIMRYSSLSE